MVILAIWLLVIGYTFIYLGSNKLSGGNAAFGTSFLGPTGLPPLIPKAAAATTPEPAARNRPVPR